jgi:hypothetical protein
MALMFPNASRSYDETRRGIRFVGHDGMFEIPFFVEIGAFPLKANGESSSERDFLAAFDAARESIQSVAREAYANSRKNRYVLTPSDFQ